MNGDNRTPFVCHVFVCVHDRQGARKSCADGTNVAVRTRLKQEVADRGWKGRARISQCGCMGLCQKGPNVVIYPQNIWFSQVGLEDIEKIVKEMAGLIAKAGPGGN